MANGNAGQPGAAADVDDPHALLDELRDDRRVQHVPGPEPSRFARPDQSTNDAVGRQRRDIRAGQVDAIAEHPNGSDRLVLEGNG